MILQDYFKKHNEGTLKQEAWEELAQELINAKFDAEKRSEWAQLLQQHGISRTSAPSARLHILHIRKYMAAASVLLVLAAAGWFFFLKSSLSPAQLMASEYLEQPFRINQGSTRGEESIEKNRGKAYEAFDTKDYEKSLSYLQLIEADGQAKAADYFQMGLCLMYQKQPNYQSALKAFNAAQKADPAVYTDEINWFSALCYLMTNDKQKANEMLQKVANSNSSRNQEAAQKLVEQLK